MADLIMKQSGELKESAKNHSQEHSLEVQLPFLQYFKGQFSFVPISIAHFATYDDLVELGKAIAAAIEEFGQDVLIVASTLIPGYSASALRAPVSRSIDHCAAASNVRISTLPSSPNLSISTCPASYPDCTRS